jgi:hypothetical protein
VLNVDLVRYTRQVSGRNAGCIVASQKVIGRSDSRFAPAVTIYAGPWIEHAGGYLRHCLLPPFYFSVTFDNKVMTNLTSTLLVEAAVGICIKD